MFRHRSLFFATCACLAFAAGCSQKDAPDTSVAAPDAVTLATEAPAEPAGPVERINPAVVLTATPNPADFCNDKKLTTVTVNWDVSAASIPTYSIWVEAPSIQRKAWVASSKPSESRETGPWVRDQTKFTLVDNTGVVVATTSVTAAECSDAAATPAADAAPGKDAAAG